MASSPDIKAGKDQTTVEVATSVTQEVKIATVQAVLSEGDIEVSEVLRDRREETLALVQRLLLSAGIQGTFSIPEADKPNEIGVELVVPTVRNAELSPEQAWFGQFKTRFEALPQLHKDVQWADVEKSLKADSESMKKLQALDAKGHNMNVFGEENGEFVFVSGWSDYAQVSADHRNIAYDLEGQKLAETNGFKPTGNAVDIATLIGVDLADTKFHEALRKAIAVNGWAWLKTDAATRTTGFAFFGLNVGVYRSSAHRYDAAGSFRAALRVKKA